MSEVANQPSKLTDPTDFMSRSEMKTISAQVPPKWVSYLAILAYIDLLFLPYFQVIIIPLSLPFVLTGIVLMGGVMLPQNTKTILLLLAFLMVLSVGVGLFLPHSAPYAMENFKRIFQFWTSFFYLAFFYTVARRYKIENTLNIVSLAFLGYFSAWLFWFILDPETVNAIMSQLYGRLVTQEDVALTHYRFAYLFSDPNTAGYFLVIAVLPWIVLSNSTVAKTTIAVICAGIALLLQSRGVLLSLILAILVSVIRWRWVSLRFTTLDIIGLSKVLAISALIGIVATSLIIRYSSNENILDVLFVLDALDRVTDADSYATGGNRFETWQRYVTSLTPLPLGSGHMFDADYGKFKPHSDLLRLIYSYGFIAAGLFIVWAIRISWRYPLILIPALMAFGINTLIDEQKLFGLFLATVGTFAGMYLRSTETYHSPFLTPPEKVRRTVLGDAPR